MKSVSFLSTVAGLAAALLIAGSAQGESSSPFSGHNSNAALTWDSASIDVQDANNRVLLTGGVTARQDNLTMRASRVTIVYTRSGSSLSVDRLDAGGGVVFERGGDLAKGDFAVYDLQRKIITLVGNVTLRQSRGEVRGGRLVIDLNTKRGTLNASPGTQSAPGGRVRGSFEVNQGK